MAAKTKWISGLDPDRPASVAAKRAIELRLRTVWHWLPLAAQREPGKPEHVHQLRVSSRRAAATLEIFADLLPRKKTKRLKRQLKAVRNAAGAARDLDVQLARWKREAVRNASISRLLKLVERDRKRAQPAIVDVNRKLKRDDHKELAKQLVDGVRFRGVKDNGHEGTLRQSARESLTPLAKSFLQAAAGDLHDVESLHRLRIAGKKLRYAMEIFAPVFAPSFRASLYATVEDLQSRLGEINDRAAAQERVLEWCKKASAADRFALRKLAAREESACVRLRNEFLAWWTPHRQAAFRKRLTACLSSRRKTAKG